MAYERCADCKKMHYATDRCAARDARLERERQGIAPSKASKEPGPSTKPPSPKAAAPVPQPVSARAGVDHPEPSSTPGAKSATSARASKTGAGKRGQSTAAKTTPIVAREKASSGKRPEDKPVKPEAGAVIDVGAGESPAAPRRGRKPTGFDKAEFNRNYMRQRRDAQKVCMEAAVVPTNDMIKLVMSNGFDPVQLATYLKGPQAQKESVK